MPTRSLNYSLLALARVPFVIKDNAIYFSTMSRVVTSTGGQTMLYYEVMCAHV